ncbi:MAG: hypothetical protein P8J44_03305 [Gammaproteobacteria bacterium]|nr:hypothetical protein [Gammaproteobacteria bacterium]
MKLSTEKRNKHVLFLLTIVGAITFLVTQSWAAGGFAPTIVARITAEPLNEISGMVKSRSYPDTYWVVNDSGAEAKIFAINSKGQNIIPTYSRFTYYGEEKQAGKKQWQGFNVLYSKNIDWESMTADDNHIYVADTGNNFNRRRDLGIYMLSEIDPTASTQSAAIKHLPVSYPEQMEFPGKGKKHFDSEALFSADGKLYLITKHRTSSGLRMEPGANLYRLDTDYTERDNLLTLVDSNENMLAVTGAELSPDGQTLAVISYDALWLFQRPQEGDQWLSSDSSRYQLDTDVLDQAETVIWDDDNTLLLSNEQRDLFGITLAELSAMTP